MTFKSLHLQCGGPSNVSDLEKQTFYKFHPIALGTLLYAIGGFPFLVWGMVRIQCYFMFSSSEEDIHIHIYIFFFALL